MQNETWWNTLFALVRIDQSPDDAMEVVVCPIRGRHINTPIHKQVIFRFIRPKEWFHFSCAATSGMINPDTLAIPHKLEYYADEAIQEDFGRTHQCPVVP